MANNVLTEVSVRQPNVAAEENLQKKAEETQKLREKVFEAVKPVFCYLFEYIGKVFHYFDPLQKTLEDINKAYKSYFEKEYHNLPKNLFDLSLSTIAIVTSCFRNTFGLCVCAFRDLGINSYELKKLLAENKPYRELLIKITNIATNCVCLVAILYGCVEVEIVSLSILIITEIACSFHEYMNGDKIMLGSHLLMSVARIRQLVTQGNIFLEKCGKTLINL